jgi:UDP-N-acetylmuramoylalanine--D-glutamate ligase
MNEIYAIFGAGMSAQAARRLVLSLGFSVVLFDEAGEGDRTTFVEDDLSEFVCFIVSPGFSVEHPWRLMAEASGKPCMSELAFAARYWKGHTIGITGTNGKSTLTGLVQDALQQSGQVSVAAGNIGYPFSDAVLSEANRPASWAVLEISSFQAEFCSGLVLDALLWSNFAEDHLDRYPSMAAYFNAKARLIDCLKPDVFVWWVLRLSDGCMNLAGVLITVCLFPNRMLSKRSSRIIRSFGALPIPRIWNWPRHFGAHWTIRLSLC